MWVKKHYHLWFLAAPKSSIKPKLWNRSLFNILCPCVLLKTTTSIKSFLDIKLSLFTILTYSSSNTTKTLQKSADLYTFKAVILLWLIQNDHAWSLQVTNIQFWLKNSQYIIKAFVQPTLSISRSALWKKLSDRLIVLCTSDPYHFRKSS